MSDLENIERDSLLQFFVLDVLERLRGTGIVECPKRLLSEGESRMIREAEKRGLCQFDDNEFKASLLWVQAGLLQQGIPVTIDMAQLLHKLRNLG